MASRNNYTGGVSKPLSTARQRLERSLVRVTGTPNKAMVPSKGLEPPHPCGYMDLNHARLPIPPRWQKVIRYGATHPGHLQERTTANILQGHRLLSNVEVGLQASGFRLWQLSQKRPLTS